MVKIHEVESVSVWSALLSPRSVAIFGASNNPNKIGGRPIAYMKRFGFSGTIVPINPHRTEVQGLPAYSSLATYGESVDAAVVAVGGLQAVEAVKEAAAAGVRACVVIASGFGEGGDVAGLQMLDEMLSHAKDAGMRLIGPNSQGIASFNSNAILSFSTLFSEIAPLDGPIAVVSQSGAMASVPYAMLRERGFGVRYVHASGNDGDLGLAELAKSAILDPSISVVVLYVENLSGADGLREAAELARERGAAILALYGGMSPAGQRAAASHTGALATEEHAAKAFFERIGILLAESLEEIVDTIPIWLSGLVSGSNRVVGISSSGASCVSISDAAHIHGLRIDEFDPPTSERLAERLPEYGASSNPVDLTAALLTDPAILGDSLDIICENNAFDVLFIALPVTGEGYDVQRFADDISRVSAEQRRLVITIVNNPRTRELFQRSGIIVFEDINRAVAAVAKVYTQVDLRSLTSGGLRRLSCSDISNQMEENREASLIDERYSQDLLEGAGVRFARRQYVSYSEYMKGEFAWEGTSGRLVVKGVTNSTPHKSEFGLVRFTDSSYVELRAGMHEVLKCAEDASFEISGFLISEHVSGDIEFIVGARFDERLGVVGVFGFGGKYAELDPDTVTLIEPFDHRYVENRLRSLRGSRVFEGFRDLPPVDVNEVVENVVNLCNYVSFAGGQVADAEVNPLIYGPSGAVGVDAVIHTRSSTSEPRESITARTI